MIRVFSAIRRKVSFTQRRFFTLDYDIVGDNRLDMVLALTISNCGDKRVNGRYLQANYLSKNQTLQFWSEKRKSKIKIKKGLTKIPGYDYAWAIVDINEQRTSDSIVLFACAGS